MITFPSATSLRDIEGAYELLSESPALRLETSLRFGGNVGVPGSLMQFLAEWSRTIEHPTLRPYGRGSTDAQEALAKEPHGMAAAYFSEIIETGADEPLSTREALANAVPRIEAMQNGNFRGTMHGRGAFLGCFARAKNEFLIPLYSRPEVGAVRSRDDFVNLTSRLIAACAPTAGQKMTEASRVALGTLLYELFRNTDEHATTDEQGRPYVKSLRAVMAKFISYEAKDAADHLGEEDPPLAFFLMHNIANRRKYANAEGKREASKQTSLLELTVVDTGPGLARRWLSRHGQAGEEIQSVSIDEEVSLVRKCFELHATTKTTAGSGGGLSHVLQTLQQLNAYLRLRTGRVCLTQDFSVPKEQVSFEPKHWLKDRPELPMAAGACYSIVVPATKVLL
ncbi:MULTISPECIES: hypothetical protein [Burkholderia]|jgi:hypothetical protein|uniref:ATP-binding protein n=2 Tax=Burkholderia contaminans TaxID=488447 RepID=A0A1E3G0R9_9BURK|nr:MULTISPECIES: hypothetical protein [Burkholderia]UTP22886.1 hypothetical protein NMB33_03395 [Burkholderia sp. FXe9]KKL43202.1 hypothetical protein WR31_04610 [Burkholderia contaminans LMG 23361]MBA9835292.1 hypothetical protein [Burkholderia contaminans]MBA9843179.1 hypothetical protein [Burkholderia contaminans]MBA9867827.1 hypothetical protein [Burkholderia contaminans]